MKKGLIFLALALAVLLSKEEAFALTISPPRIEIAADVGTEVRGEILIINDEDTTRTLYSSFENFEAQDEGGTPKFVGSQDGLATWLSAPESVTLSPGESKRVPFTIDIPDNAAEAGYFGVIFWGTAPNTDGGQVTVGAKIGTLVFLTVGTNIPESAGLMNFGVKDGKFLHRSLPVVFDYRFTNSGADRIKPTGEITLRSILGWRAAKIDANPFQGNILPRTTRRFSPEWTKLAPDERAAPVVDEKYSFGRELKEQWNNFALGIFRAKMNLTYGAAAQELESKATYFIVFPLELMLIVLPGIFIVFYILRKSIRRYNRYIIKKARLASSQ